MKSLLVVAALAAQAAFAGHSYFVAKTEDGREEMKVSCDGAEGAATMDCRIRLTQFIVPDPAVPSQFSENARRLAQGDDSLRVKLCKELHLIEPRVPEARDIVQGLKDACGKGDARALAGAYAKMDTLSKKTCIVLNGEELLTFRKGDKGSWAYESRNGEACFALKRYVIRDEGGKSLERTIEYSNSTAVACLQERYIDKTKILKQWTDGRAELPGSCRYIYLE